MIAVNLTPDELAGALKAAETCAHTAKGALVDELSHGPVTTDEAQAAWDRYRYASERVDHLSEILDHTTTAGE